MKRILLFFTISLIVNLSWGQTEKSVVKGYFMTGLKPTQGQFHTLIDNSYNSVTSGLLFGTGYPSISFQPWSTPGNGRLYFGSSIPTGNSLLNYDGYFRATKLYAGEIEVNGQSVVTGNNPLDFYTNSLANNDFLLYNPVNLRWENKTLSYVLSLLFPSQTGNTGKFLSTNGTSLLWADPVGGSGSELDPFWTTDSVRYYTRSFTRKAISDTASVLRSLISSIGTYTAGNGLTKVSSEFRLGGNLSSDILFGGGRNRTFQFGTATGAQEMLNFNVFVNDGTHPTSIQWGTTSQLLNPFNHNSLLFSKSIAYSGDYSSSFTSNSLINKGYADLTYNYLAGNGLIKTGNVFDLGGTLTGSVTLNGGTGINFNLGGLTTPTYFENINLRTKNGLGTAYLNVAGNQVQFGGQGHRDIDMSVIAEYLGDYSSNMTSTNDIPSIKKVANMIHDSISSNGGVGGGTVLPPNTTGETVIIGKDADDELVYFTGIDSMLAVSDLTNDSVINSILGLGYGYLYNWYAVNTGKLAPTGWSVPTQAQLWNLCQLSGADDTNSDSLREKGTTHWTNENNANNAFGFTMVGSGKRNIDGTFQYLKTSCYLYCQEANASQAFYYQFGWGSSIAVINYLSGKYGYAVRCVRTTDPGVSQITDIDGNIYPVVKIGSLWWLARNLCVTKLNDGTPIPNVTDNTAWSNLSTAGRCAYNNDERNAVFGKAIKENMIYTNPNAPAVTNLPQALDYIIDNLP